MLLLQQQSYKTTSYAKEMVVRITCSFLDNVSRMQTRVFCIFHYVAPLSILLVP